METLLFGLSSCFNRYSSNVLLAGWPVDELAHACNDHFFVLLHKIAPAAICALRNLLCLNYPCICICRHLCLPRRMCVIVPSTSGLSGWLFGSFATWTSKQASSLSASWVLCSLWAMTRRLYHLHKRLGPAALASTPAALFLQVMNLWGINSLIARWTDLSDFQCRSCRRFSSQVPILL